MNMQLRPSEFAPEPPSEITKMIAAYTDLEALMSKSCGISDDAMDALSKAQSEIGEAISDTAVTTSKDIAAKLRFLAALVEDDDGGFLYLEPELLESTAKDLARFRLSQWVGPDRAVFLECNPFYAALVAEDAQSSAA